MRCLTTRLRNRPAHELGLVHVGASAFSRMVSWDAPEVFWERRGTFA